MRYFLITLFLMISIWSWGQDEKTTPSITSNEEPNPFLVAEDSLQALAKTFMTEKNQELRLEAAEKFKEDLMAILASPNSFDYPFDSLFNVSKLYPEDSLFRVMTWQLYVDVDEYKYFGIIQTKKTKKKESQVFVLEDYSARMKRIDDITLSKDNWYGALYYNMRPFKTKEGTKYLLFGFDAYSFFEKRKLLDVLSFDKDGEPVFGAPVIQRVVRRNNVPPRTATYHRFVLQYSSTTAVNLNYNELEDMVLFDHLVSMGSGRPEIPYVMIPDGSYEGFQLKKGIWTHVEKVFDHKYEQGDFPRPMPILDKRKNKSIIDK